MQENILVIKFSFFPSLAPFPRLSLVMIFLVVASIIHCVTLWKLCVYAPKDAWISIIFHDDNRFLSWRNTPHASLRLNNRTTTSISFFRLLRIPVLFANDGTRKEHEFIQLICHTIAFIFYFEEKKNCWTFFAWKNVQIRSETMNDREILKIPKQFVHVLPCFWSTHTRFRSIQLNVFIFFRSYISHNKKQNIRDCDGIFQRCLVCSVLLGHWEWVSSALRTDRKQNYAAIYNHV